jgi:hypothetical protein
MKSKGFRFVSSAVVKDINKKEKANSFLEAAFYMGAIALFLLIVWVVLVNK